MRPWMVASGMVWHWMAACSVYNCTVHGDDNIGVINSVFAGFVARVPGGGFNYLQCVRATRVRVDASHTRYPRYTAPQLASRSPGQSGALVPWGQPVPTTARLSPTGTCVKPFAHARTYLREPYKLLSSEEVVR